MNFRNSPTDCMGEEEEEKEVVEEGKLGEEGWVGGIRRWKVRRKVGDYLTPISTITNDRSREAEEVDGNREEKKNRE